MNHNRFNSLMRILLGALTLSAAVLLRPARACLTSTIDKKAVQWSTAVVQAKLVSLGTKTEFARSAVPPSAKPSTRPVAVAYRVLRFEVGDSLDGPLVPGDQFNVVALVGGQPGDGACPAMMPESVGKKFILLLRPFVQTALDLPDGTSIGVPHDAMVIVSLLSDADVNEDTLPDLKTFIGKARADAAVKPDDISAQADAVAGAQDQTEAEQAEKAITDMGPVAVPALEQRLKTANEAGRTRLKRLIDDLTPPVLAAEPE